MMMLEKFSLGFGYILPQIIALEMSFDIFKATDKSLLLTCESAISR